MGTKINSSDITIVVPTRGRKANVERLLSNISHRPLILVSEQERISEDLPSDLKGATVELAPPACGSPKAFEVGIEAAKTSHVLMLCDDIRKPADDFIQQLADYTGEIHRGDEAVIIPSDGHNAVDFPMMPRDFYMRHIYPTPYKKYCLDNEIVEKAKRLCLAQRANHVRIPHLIEGGNDKTAQKEDSPIFHQRMAKFAQTTSGITRKAFIAAPVYRTVDYNFFNSMQWLLTHFTCNAQIETHAGECPIGRARNDLTRRFLESDCTHILFIDSDICFGPDQVTRILEHDEDVVGGFYPLKCEGAPRMCFNPLPERNVTENDLLEVRYIGTGFLRVSRRAFELMIQHFGEEIWYTRDCEPFVKEYNFWHMGPYQYEDGTRRWLSEDWWFCQRWRDIGGKVYGDLRIALKHSGQILFPLQSQEEKIFKQARLETSASGEEAVPSPPTGALLEEAKA